MGLTIHNNMMAAKASRSLQSVYGRLNTSVQRLSSGLRVNSSADDAAGLAIREMMRADIAATRQGIRNAADAISMVQTADGALGVIDEKLTRMKELAEQAATGTYTTVQRDIINSEYQAMAAEIDRIASATNFNGIKLLDGSVSNQHGGRGIKVHFGTSNNPAEDYYFVNIGDARATSSTGLRVGGDAKNDIWAQGAAASEALDGPGCCVGGFESLNGAAGFSSGQSFSYGYNWDWREVDDEELLSPRYLAGRYTVGSGDSLQNLIDKVNQGAQSRVAVKIDEENLAQAISAGGLAAICFGDEAYIYGSSVTVSGTPERTVFSTEEILAEVAYDPKLAYINSGGNTFVFRQGTDPLMIAALSRLSLAEIELPGSYVAQENHNGDIAYIQDINAPPFQERRDDYIADNWQDAAHRLELRGADRNPADIINGLMADFQAALAANGSLFDPATSAITGADSFDVPLNIYGDFSDLDSPKGVYTRNSDIADLFGFTQLTVSLEAVAAGPDGEMRVNAYINGEQIAESYGPAAAMHKDYFEFAFRAALGRAVFGAGEAYELTGATPYGGPPPVNPRDIEVISYDAAPSITVCDKDITMMKRDADGRFNAAGLASAVNTNAESDFWATLDSENSAVLYLFAKEGGDNNHLTVSELLPASTAEFRAAHKDIINQLDMGIQDRVAVDVNEAALWETFLNDGLTAIRFGKEAYVYGDAAVGGTPNHTSLSVYETVNELLYDPKLGSINQGGSTLFFNSSNADLLAALSRLGRAPTIAPGSQALGQGLTPAGVAPLFQNALNAYINSNWADADHRIELGGTSHNPTTALIDTLWGNFSSQIPDTIYSATTGVLLSGQTFTGSVDIYGDFPGPTGVFTRDSALAGLMGLNQLKLTFETVPALDPTEVTINVYLNGVATPLVSLPPGSGRTESDFKDLFGDALNQLVFSAGAYELTGNPSRGPTVNPADIDVNYDTFERDLTLENTNVTLIPGGRFTAEDLANAVGGNAGSGFRAVYNPEDGDVVYLFKKGSVKERQDVEVSDRMRASFSFQNVETGEWDDEVAGFSLGGEPWARMGARQSRAGRGQESWNVILSGRDVGAERDIKIAGENDLFLPGLGSAKNAIRGLDGESFHEIQNAADAAWAGAELRTQSSAQESLEALTAAIAAKDTMRANLGAVQNRLENTITNLEIQAESLAASESRISDVDVAKEMTAFTKNNILVQAAVGMLSQANSMNQLALSLLT